MRTAVPALAFFATALLAPPVAANSSLDTRPPVILAEWSARGSSVAPQHPPGAVDLWSSSVEAVQDEVVSWRDTLLSAVEKSAVIGFVPAIVHAARGDADRAIRAAACCTGSTAFVIVNAGIQIATSGYLLAGCAAIPTAVATSACGYVLGSRSAIVAESSIADMISDPRIREQCRSRGGQHIEETVSGLMGAVSGYIFGLPEAVKVFSPQFLKLLRWDMMTSVGCTFAYVAGAAAVVPAAKSVLRGLAGKAARGKRARRRSLAVDFENNIMLGIPGNFLIVPEVVGDDGESVPVDLRLTTHMLWVLTETEVAPALNVMPLVLEDPRQAAKKMDAMDFAEVTSVLYALDGADYAAVDASGPAPHRAWLHEAVTNLVGAHRILS